MAQNPKIFGKELKLSWTDLIIGGAMILLGLILAIWPDTAVSVVIGGIGGVCIIVGAIHLVRYCMLDARTSIRSNEMGVGLLWLLAGVLVIALHRFLLSLVPVIFGIILLVGGIGKLQYTASFRRMGVTRWYFELVSAALSVGFGAIILLNPFNTVLLLMRIIGIALLIEGVQDIISRYAYKKASDAYFTEFKD